MRKSGAFLKVPDENGNPVILEDGTKLQWQGVTKFRLYCKEHKEFSFREILEGSKSKMKMIVVFLTILELMKLGKIEIQQEHTFDDILIISKMTS